MRRKVQIGSNASEAMRAEFSGESDRTLCTNFLIKSFLLAGNIVLRPAFAWAKLSHFISLHFLRTKLRARKPARASQPTGACACPLCLLGGAIAPRK